MYQSDSHSQLRIRTHPIYFVISERVTDYAGQLSMYYALPNLILDVIECDAADIQAVWDERVAPLLTNGRKVQATYFSREVDTPFRQWRFFPGRKHDTSKAE